MLALGLLSGLWRKSGSVASPWSPADTTSLVHATNALADYSEAGQTLYDISGNGDHLQLGSTAGTDTNDPQWTTDPTDGVGCLRYHANDYCYDVGGASTPGAWGISGDITIFGVMHVPASDANPKTLYSCGWGTVATTRTSYHMDIAYAFNPDRIRLIWSNGVTVGIYNTSNNSIPPTEEWFTIAGTHKASTSTAVIYVNAATVAGSGVNLSTPVAALANSNFVLGAAPISAGTPPTVTGECWDTHMGPTMLYNAYKTSTEIAAMHNDIVNNFPQLNIAAV